MITRRALQNAVAQDELHSAALSAGLMLLRAGAAGLLFTQSLAEELKTVYRKESVLAEAAM